MNDKSESEPNATKRGRPVIYGPKTYICLHSTGQSRLQKDTDRRAIVNLIVDKGGRMTMAEIDEHFGFSMQTKIAALRRSGWLDVCADEPEEEGEEE